MPWKSRIDTHDCLHHIIESGHGLPIDIEDYNDRENFLTCLGTTLRHPHRRQPKDSWRIVMAVNGQL